MYIIIKAENISRIPKKNLEAGVLLEKGPLSDPSLSSRNVELSIAGEDSY